MNTSFVSNPPDVGSLLELTGPLLFAGLFNWASFGILTVQVYIYYIAFPTDTKALKSVVTLAYLLETVQTALFTRDIERVFVHGYGDTSQLDLMGLYWLSVPMMSAAISALCQLFYAWRIYAFSQNRWVAGIISLLAVTECAFELYDGVICLKVGHLLGLPDSLAFEVFAVFLSTSTICDILITSSMMYYLQQARRSTIARRTDSLITHLLKVTVETGFICSAVSVAAMACFFAADNTLLYTTPVTMLGKVHSNCLLAVLNSRARIVRWDSNVNESDNALRISLGAKPFASGQSSMAFRHSVSNSREGSRDIGSEKAQGTTPEATSSDTKVIEINSKGLASSDDPRIRVGLAPTEVTTTVANSQTTSMLGTVAICRDAARDATTLKFVQIALSFNSAPPP
ncbi:hypothetical protein BXZ70DRAFT_1011445 [Cristinia sonorae]|uniref:DUF6534 domain-containing protein n=1 Tax=Cristinia sonorae TaxID=1940300 RepID=A0A8K0UH79_9AGAR|nr:hypothetical protein BXZ70DRAFT_1011445 [Cristinia sonorae]